MTPEPDEYLVVLTYKGHVNSVVVKAKENEVEINLRKRGYKGDIDNIYPPGEWHYSETLNPVPGEE